MAAEDHPRIRGEHCGRFRRVAARPGSSPHTRGAPPGRPSPARIPRIIPAYAGSTTKLGLDNNIGGGSSPHTRGARADPPGRQVA